MDRPYVPPTDVHETTLEALCALGGRSLKRTPPAQLEREAGNIKDLIGALRAMMTRRGTYSPIGRSCESRLMSDCVAEQDPEPCPLCCARKVLASMGVRA